MLASGSTLFTKVSLLAEDDEDCVSYVLEQTMVESTRRQESLQNISQVTCCRVRVSQ